MADKYIAEVGIFASATKKGGQVLTCNLRPEFCIRLGNLLSEKQTVNGFSGSGTGVMSYDYDESGILTGKRYPSGKRIEYQRDVLDRVKRIIDNAGNRVELEYSYEGPARVKEKIFGNSTGMAISYDQNRRIQSIEHRKVDPQTKLPVSEASMIIVQNNETLIKDYNTNNRNQYTSIDGEEIRYDNNGNVTEDEKHYYYYDYANRLIKIERKPDNFVIGEYRYDVFGRRTARRYYDERTESSYEMTYYYDGGEIVEELDDIGDTIATYIYGIDIDEVVQVEYLVESAQHPVTGVFYYHTNDIGSVYAITDSEGEVVEQYEYDIYGVTAIYSAGDSADGGTTRAYSAVCNTFMWTGRELDIESGLYYFRARYYSVLMGRFMSIDPIGADSFGNMYSYVAGYADPWGLSPKQTVGIVDLARAWEEKYVKLQATDSEQEMQIATLKGELMAEWEQINALMGGVLWADEFLRTTPYASKGMMNIIAIIMKGIQFYGRSIEWSKVTILIYGEGRPRVIPIGDTHHINWPEEGGEHREPSLIHELFHIWQYQRGMNVKSRGIMIHVVDPIFYYGFFAWLIVNKPNPYKYYEDGGSLDDRLFSILDILSIGDNITALGLEKQAQIVEDYYKELQNLKNRRMWHQRYRQLGIDSTMMEIEIIRIKFYLIVIKRLFIGVQDAPWGVLEQR